MRNLTLVATHTARKTRVARMRAPRALWSDAELALLKHLMWLAEPGAVDCRKVAYLFPGRCWKDIKRRCCCIRDLARRKERKRQHAEQQAKAGAAEPDSPTSVMSLPPEGRLHPTLVWVPSTGDEIGPMNLRT
jgi:hypothetical protein